MSAFARKAALVVGAVALVAATAGAAAPLLAPGMAGAAGITGVASAATLTAIGTYGGLAAGVLTAISTATAPGLSSQGSATSFQTNPQSGLPYAMGRTRMSGLRIYANTNTRPGYTKFNDLLWFGALLSIGGAIGGIEKFTADNEIVSFDASGNAIGDYHDYQGQKVHLGGQQTSALALSLVGGSAPGWTTAHKLSGITHAMWCLRYNKQGEMYGAGAPEPAWIGNWVKVYDPRLDSTYPGGSGSCRALVESTYVWSDNPGLHALTWALGRWQNGKRTCGIGAPVANIRVAEFVECANVCEANGWKVGGVEWTTDSKWDTLKRILQSGGAIPTQTGAMVGCLVSTPRTAIATIESRHLLDSLSIAATKSRRDRFNSVIPRYVDEDSDWSVISGTAITVSDYVTADKGQRTKEIDYPLVQVFSGQLAKQPGQLAAYDIVNSREAGPINFTTGPEWIGLKTGDVILLNVPEEGLVNQPVLITRRAPDPSTGKVAFSAQTETYAKHAYALGQSTTPPAPFSLTAPDLKPPAPAAANWAAAGTVTGEGLPAIVVTGNSEMPSADAVLIDYRLPADATWTRSAILSANEPVQHVIAPLQSETAYQVRVGYRVEQIDGEFTILAAVTTGAGIISDISDTIGQQRDELDQLQLDTAAAAAAAAAAQSQIAAIEGSISADFSAVNAEVDALQGSLSTAQSNIAALQSSQSSLSTSVSNLQSSMTAAQSSISNLQSSVNASLSALNSDVDALETQAANIAASVSGLNTQVGSINTNVSALTTRIADAEGDIDSLQSTVASQGAAITANATAITNAQGSLAEYSLRLSSNRRNLLPNGGPEALLRGWTGSATWAVNTNNSEGAYFLCTPTASGTFVLTSDAIPMEAAVALTLAYETRNTGATSYCDIQCYDAAGANLMDSGQNAAASGTVWGDRASRAFTLTTPANTASVRVRLVCVATSASYRARIRQIKLEKGATWSAYSNDASVAQAFSAISSAEANVASLQTTVATQGASITSNATAVTALTGRTATLETTVSSQGATIGTLQSAVSTANGNIASLTTRVNVSQTNLLPNGGLENGFSGVITSGSFSWSNAPEWGPIATTSTNGTQVFEFADITAVQVGATYWISCDPLALGTSSIYCDLLFLDASGNVLLDGGQNSQGAPFNFSANDTRRSLIAVSAVAPSGTAKIRPRVVANVVSNQVAGFRRVKVETGNSWTPFSSEASLFSNWSATNTATASVASLTTTVSTQGASISSAQTAITTLQGSVSSLQTTVSTQGASITSLQSTTSTHTGQIAQHTTDIATANSNISTNAQAITTANGNIASLTTRVSSAESSISSQATAITGLAGRTATLETTVSSQGASITSLQTTTSTTSANLATLTTRVNAASTNLLKYGGFESGATGWVIVGAASWGAVNGFWGPFVNTAGLSNGNAGLQSEQFDASPGQAWTASVDAEFLATAGQMYLQMAFLVSGSWTTVGTVTKALGAGFTSTADGRLRTTQTAPANTTKVRMQIGVVNVTGVTNCGFRQAKLEVGSVMSPYSNEASVYQTIQTLTTATGSLATLSTTVSTQGSSITSLQSSYTSLSGSLASLTTRVGTAESSITSLQSASTTQAGQISTLQSTVATQGSSISSNATAITTLQGNVASLTTRVNAAQTNLLVNGGLENGFSGAVTTSTFVFANSGAWGPSATTSVNGTQVFEFGDIVGVQQGATYWISCDPLAFGSSTIYCDLLFLDASGNVLLDGGQNAQTGPFDFSGNNSRRALIAASAVAPSGATRMRARIVGEVVSNAVVGFRRVKVERGEAWSGFSSEASIVQSFTAYSGLDSSLATLSSTVSTQGGSITSLQSSFTSLNGTVSSLSSTVSAQGTSISTLQSASSTQSGQIATLQTQIVLGGNLLQNTDFAVDTSGWFFNQSGSSHTGARDLLGDAYRLPNEHTVGIRQGDTNSTAYAFWQSTAVAVEPGKYYEASCLGANVNANLTIYLRYQDANGGIVQDFTAAKTSDSQGATLSGFLPLFRRGLAPAGATKAVVILLKNSTKAGTESYGWFIRPQLAQVPGLTGGPVAYSPGSASTTISTQATALSNATSSLASLTTTVNTQGATISSQATAISTLQGQQSSLSSTVSAQGASITSLQTATSTLQGNVATLTTRVGASSPNLLPNGGLENGFASGISSTGGYSFASSADWGTIATTTATGTQVFQFAPVAVNAGRVYTLACDPVCTGSGSTVYCDMLFRDASNNILLDSAQNVLTGAFDFDTTTGRRGQIAITATAPTGTTNVVCRFVGVAANGGTVGFRQMKLERGSTWSPYSAEASITQTFSTLSTLSTQYASLSSTVATQGVSISTQATAITTIQNNVTTLFGQYVLDIDVNGRVAGMKLANNGSASSIIFRADLVRFEDPDPGTGAMEWKDQAIQMRDGAGKLRIFMGYRA